MTAVSVAQRPASSEAKAVSAPIPAPLSLWEAVSQVSDASRNLLGLMALSSAAARDLDSGSPQATLDGVVSKAVLRRLLGALNYRDSATLRHSRRVALLCVGLAQHLGWEGRHLRILEVAALLHDVGKIGVPDNVLYKPGELSEEEVDLFEIHHSIGINVLQACRVDPDVLRIVDQSHRAHVMNLNTSPMMREVHMGARILAVADAYESLCTEKVYRGAKSHEEILQILMSESNKQFDGNVVSSLANWVQKDGLPFAAQTAELNEAGKNQQQFELDEVAEAMALCQIFSYLYAIESLYDGFHLIDCERRFVVWNRGAERLIGRSASEMLGHEWSPDLFGTGVVSTNEDSVGRKISTIDDAISRERMTIYKMSLPRTDEGAISLELQTVPLIDAKGCLHGVAEIARNLSRKSRSIEFSQLKLQASRDALTSVANRGELERQLKLLGDVYRDHPTEPYCVIFADADHFKRVNDTFGHQVGDRVLIDLARHFSEETYSGEIVGRYGGEEFIILCPATDLEHAVRRAERLRCSLKNAKIGGDDRLKLSCSFGVAQVEPQDTTDTVLKRADRALYEAKASGRDRTCFFTSAQSNGSHEKTPETQKEELTFAYSTTFSAFLASDMFVHKLSAFVKDHKVKLNHVSRERIVMSLPGAGMISGLFEAPVQRQGIEIELLMECSDRADESKRRKIQLRTKPAGRYQNLEAFNKRSYAVAQELKKYFAAD